MIWGRLSGGRVPTLELVLNDFTEDKEQRIKGSLKMTFKKSMKYDEDGGRYVECAADDPDVAFGEGDIYTFHLLIWVNNLTYSQSQIPGAYAGRGGYMIKPQKNEDEEMVWQNNNEDIARLSWMNDSEPMKYYAKLSTKWNNEIYQEQFADRDAYKFEFVGEPKVSSTSRATLELYCPFVDEDGELNVDASELSVYQLVEDELVDVTDRWKLAQDEDDRWYFSYKCRELGHYVIAGPQETAAEESK